MKRSVELTNRILEVLDVDPRKVTGIEYRHRLGGVPTVVLRLLVIGDGELGEVSKSYELVEIEEGKAG